MLSENLQTTFSKQPFISGKLHIGFEKQYIAQIEPECEKFFKILKEHDIKFKKALIKAGFTYETYGDTLYIKD